MGMKYTVILVTFPSGAESFAGRDWFNATPEGTYSALVNRKILKRTHPHCEYHLATFEVQPFGTGIRNVPIATPLPLSLGEVF